jgi:hypothetical protein
MLNRFGHGAVWIRQNLAATSFVAVKQYERPETLVASVAVVFVLQPVPNWPVICSVLRTPHSALATDSFPEFILGWTIGGSAPATGAVSSALAGNTGDVFDEGVEHDSRGGCAPHSEFRRGNGSRRLGARSLAMTEIRCRRTGILFLYSFWNEIFTLTMLRPPLTGNAYNDL